MDSTFSLQLLYEASSLDPSRPVFTRPLPNTAPAQAATAACKLLELDDESAPADD